MKKHGLFLSLFILIVSCIHSQTYYAFINLLNKDKLRKDEIHGYINNLGKITYREGDGESIRGLSEGLGVIRKNGKFGYIDPDGNVIIPIIYDDAESFSEGLAAVKTGGKWGYINKKNEWVIKPTLVYNGSFINHFAYYIDETIMQNNLYKFIDTTGKFINDTYYINANKFSDNCAWVKDKKVKAWGCINNKGEYIIEPKYNRVTAFKNGRSWVEIKNKWGCINKKGEYIVEPIYDDTNNELHGYTWVTKGGKWGMLDSTGKTVIAFDYKNTTLYKLKGAFSYVKFSTPANERLAYNSGTKAGYYDLSFKTVIEPQFEEVTNFMDGVAAVKLKNKWGLINTEGKLICDYKFENVKYLNHGLYCTEIENNSIIIFDKNGTLINNEDFIKVRLFE